MLPNQGMQFPPYFYGPPFSSPCKLNSKVDSPFFMQSCYPYMYGNIPAQGAIYGLPDNQEVLVRPEQRSSDQLRRET